MLCTSADGCVLWQAKILLYSTALTAITAKEKADITKKSYYSYSSRCMLYGILSALFKFHQFCSQYCQFYLFASIYVLSALLFCCTGLPLSTKQGRVVCRLASLWARYIFAPTVQCLTYYILFKTQFLISGSIFYVWALLFKICIKNTMI